MSVGVALTWAVHPGVDNGVEAVVRTSREVAAAGVRSVWLGQRFDFDSIALAGIVGREVPGLRVGTSAVPIYPRHPILISAQAQTSQAATGGRYSLGLALGSRPFLETSFGGDFDRPIARLREFLTAIRPLLHEGTADFHGETLTAAPVLPATLPGGAAPPVPVLVAAMAPQSLRVSGELADGILPFLAGPKALEEHIVPAVTAAAEAAGRPAPRVVALVAGAVTDDVDAARERAAEQMAFYDQLPSYRRVIGLSGGSRAADLVELGDEKALEAAVRRYHDAGATEVVISQTDLVSPADQRRTWDVLGQLAQRVDR